MEEWRGPSRALLVLPGEWDDGPRVASDLHLGMMETMAVLCSEGSAEKLKKGDKEKDKGSVD
jgi:hypothetical protein